MDRFPKIAVTPSFLIMIALLLLMLPMPWTVSFLIASLVHEIGHVIALRLLGITILGVSIDHGGANIRTEPITSAQEVITALAGPLSGISLLMVSGTYPRIAFCGCVQGLINLIPIYPSDGGRILNAAVLALLPDKLAVYAMHIVKAMILISMGIVSAWLCFNLKMGLLAFAPMGLIWIKGAISSSMPIKYCLQRKGKKGRIQ